MSSIKPANYRKGDVVLVSFPYTTDDGQTQTKRRPAVIISNDMNNLRLDDVLLVPLTSNTTRAHKEPTQVEINMNSPEGQQGGLRLDSVIDCTVIATIPKTLLVNKIGAFPQETMERIDQCLMIAMAIGRPVRSTQEFELLEKEVEEEESKKKGTKKKSSEAADEEEEPPQLDRAAGDDKGN
jgi:mRNA interferase MazF